MKKFIKSIKLFLSLTLATFLLVGCGGGNKSSATNSDANTSAENIKILTADEFKQMYSDPNKFKNNKVNFYARIFLEPEKDDKGTYFQCYANNDDSMNTLVTISDPKLDVKDGDIIYITGVVAKAYTGKNAFGGEVTAPVITADKVLKADYATAFAPAVKTVDLNKEINQHGYIMKVNKVEFAEKETRVYLTINNASKDKISFYSFNSKATQGSSQFEIADNYDAKYPEIESEILPGIKEEGIIVFKPMNPAGENAKLIIEGRSDNYQLDFTPFIFDIPLK